MAGRVTRFVVGAATAAVCLANAGALGGQFAATRADFGAALDQGQSCPATFRQVSREVVAMAGGGTGLQDAATVVTFVSSLIGGIEGRESALRTRGQQFTPC